MAIFDYLVKALRVAGQLPLDDKLVFPTLTQMEDLGAFNTKPYEYYKFMKVLCQEDGQYYIWEPVAAGYAGGVLAANFQYAPDTVTNGIVYSNEYYNFVPEVEGIVPQDAFGRPWIIFKDWTVNKNPWLEVNDCVMGYFDTNNLILARYKGGPVNQLSSFAQIDGWNPKAFN